MNAPSLKLLCVVGGAGGGEGSGLRLVEVFFAEGEAEDDAVGELDGEGAALVERGGLDGAADLRAESVAVLGLAEGDGEVGQHDVGPVVEGEQGGAEAQLEVVLDECDGAE